MKVNSNAAINMIAQEFS